MLFFSGAVQASCEPGFAPDNPDEIYEIHGDGTVTDTRTGLMWKRCAEGLTGELCADGEVSIMTWGDALEHARSSTFAGHDDWRLPNFRELQSLAEHCRTDPAINETAFPNTTSSYFWSASPYAGSSDYAWLVYFYDGYSSYYFRNGSHRVRAVRGGQSFELFEGVFDDRFEAGGD